MLDINKQRLKKPNPLIKVLIVAMLDINERADGMTCVFVLFVAMLDINYFIFISYIYFLHCVLIVAMLDINLKN